MIEKAVARYQEALRQLFLLAFCLDFSGSMDGEREAQLKAALGPLLDPGIGRRYLLQATEEDVFIAFRFSNIPWDPLMARGPEEARELSVTVARLEADGGTEM